MGRRIIQVLFLERISMRRNLFVVAAMSFCLVSTLTPEAKAGGFLKKLFKKSEPACCEPAPEPAPTCCEPAPEPAPTCCEPAPEPAPVCCEPEPPKCEPAPEPAPTPCCEPAPPPTPCCASIVLPSATATYVVHHIQYPVQPSPSYVRTQPEIVAITSSREVVGHGTEMVSQISKLHVSNQHFVSFH